MTEREDSWMDPATPFSWSLPDGTKEPWLIEREQRVQGPLTQWRVWSRHATEAERDEELRQLRDQHPAWHLRPGRYRPMMAIG